MRWLPKLKRFCIAVVDEFKKGVVKLIGWSIPAVVAILCWNTFQDKVLNPDMRLENIYLKFNNNKDSFEDFNIRPATMFDPAAENRVVYSFKPNINISLQAVGKIQDVYLAYGYEDDKIDEGSIYRIQGGHKKNKEWQYNVLLNYNVYSKDSEKAIYLIVIDSKTLTKNVFLINLFNDKIEYANVIDSSDFQRDKDSQIKNKINLKENKGDVPFEFYSEQELMSMVRNEKAENLKDIKSPSLNRESILKTMSILRNMK